VNDSAAETLRCGSCGFETTPEEMYAHIRSCSGWVTLSGDDLADIAREAGFEPRFERASWWARVFLRRKDRYVID
jgi:hypothetical protein